MCSTEVPLQYETGLIKISTCKTLHVYYVKKNIIINGVSARKV